MKLRRLGTTNRAPAAYYAARSTVTGVPARTLRNTVGSPRSVPKRFTGLAGRISPGLLIGVGPKKMQNARPGGQ